MDREDKEDSGRREMEKVTEEVYCWKFKLKLFLTLLPSKLFKAYLRHFEYYFCFQANFLILLFLILSFPFLLQMHQ
jgi:hypothetical protein